LAPDGDFFKFLGAKTKVGPDPAPGKLAGIEPEKPPKLSRAGAVKNEEENVNASNRDLPTGATGDALNANGDGVVEEAGDAPNAKGAGVAEVP